MYIGKNDGVCPITQAEIDRDKPEIREYEVDPDAAYDAEQSRLMVHDQEAMFLLCFQKPEISFKKEILILPKKIF